MKKVIYILAASAVLLLLCCKHKPLGNSQPSAVEVLAELQKEAQTAGKAGDMPGRLRAALKMQGLLHDAPDAVEFTAQAYWGKADTQNALKMLRLFADLGQTDTGLVKGNVKRFAEYRGLPQYQSIVERLAGNQTRGPRRHGGYLLGAA